MGVSISAKNLVQLNECYYRQQLNLLLGWRDKDVVEEMFFQLQDAAKAGNNTEQCI